MVATFTGAFAQKNEINEAKKKWGVFQVVMNQSTEKQLELLNGAMKHADAATAHDKTKNTAEAWAYKAVFTSSLAVVDTLDFANAAKNEALAIEAIKTANSFAPTASDQELLTISQDNIEAYQRNLGFIQYGRKDFKGAFNSFLKVLEKNPTDTAMYGNLGLAAAADKNYPEAVKYYKKAIEMGSPDSKSFYQDVFILQIETLADTASALATVQEAAAKFPDEMYFLANEADIYIKKGDYEKTFAMMNKLMAKEPENVNFIRITADTYFNQAFDFQEQIRKFELEKKYKEADEYIKKKEESLKNALPLYLKVEAADPKDEEVIKLIRNVYFALGNNEKAEEYSKKINAQ